MEHPLSAPVRTAGAPTGSAHTCAAVSSASRSWDEVVRSHSGSVYRLAYRLTGNPHDAEDLTQEVFVRVFRKLDSSRPGTFDGWLYRITVNLFRDQVRHTRRLSMEPLRDDFADQHRSPQGSPDDILADRTFDEDIQRALSRLSPDSRSAVLLCDIDGLSYDEIATVLGIKRGTVGSHINRGRAQLRAALAHRACRAAPTRP